MAAQDAVLVAAVARQNVRDSLARMEYHLARGARGTLGVEREVLFLDGLSREATRLGGNTQVGFKTKATQGLGARAKAALSSGSGATIGRAKSSLLATFSDETMFGARSWTYAGGQQWVWQANASACAACLANHGSRFFGSMFPEHPSCLCFPVPPDQAGHITSLSDSQLTDVLRDSNNPRFRAQAKLIDSGRLSVRDAIAGARRPSTRAFYERTLARLTEGVYGATTEVVGAGTVTVAATTAVETKPLTWVDDWQKAGKLELNAKKSEALLADAVATADKRLLGLDNLKAGFDRSAARLDRIRTVNARMANDGSRLLGEVRTWRHRITRDVQRQELLLDVGRMSDEAVKKYNEAYRAYNLKRRQLDFNRGFAGRDEYKQLTQELRALKPPRRSVKRGATVDELTDTLIHEMTHVLDTSGKLATKLLQDDILVEFRKYATSGKYQAEFKYGSEFQFVTPKGGETLAELVKMYTSGLGEAMTAEVWRETYPILSDWVLKNVVNGTLQ